MCGHGPFFFFYSCLDVVFVDFVLYCGYIFLHLLVLLVVLSTVFSILFMSFSFPRFFFKIFYVLTVFFFYVANFFYQYSLLSDPFADCFF